jgi:ferrochelatase
VQVVCPGFSVDCLETLEEIALENRAAFLGAGGEAYDYIPCLNDDPAHINLFAELVTQNL